jgi:ribonucleotide reductase beta subunit family protein with ferritin-like domain
MLKEHLLENKPISQICDENNLHVTVFQRWTQQLFENSASAFEKKNKHEELMWQKKALKLERKLVKKNEVLSELMEEHVALKKSLGED